MYGNTCKQKGNVGRRGKYFPSRSICFSSVLWAIPSRNETPFSKQVTFEDLTTKTLIMPPRHGYQNFAIQRVTVTLHEKEVGDLSLDAFLLELAANFVQRATHRPTDGTKQRLFCSSYRLEQLPELVRASLIIVCKL